MLKGLFVLFLLILTSVSSYSQNLQDLNLMPAPQKLEAKSGKLILDDAFTISVNGDYTARVKKYSERMLERLAGRTGIFFKHNHADENKNSGNTTLTVNTGREGMLRDNEDESYELIIENNRINLTSNTDIGSLRGLETLLQLLLSDKDGYYFPNVKIQDAPRFTWRGLMIDGCRHFIPIDVIKRNLEGMAAVKMNVMHWHLTEDQGFRVECKTFPELHTLGSDGKFYTQEQIKEVINFAKDLGIRVVPEFDIPGHSTAWFVSHPEFASASGPYTIERKWGIFDPTFDPTKEEVYDFFDKFFNEMAALFPDEYMHIGGDENNGKQWSANARIRKFMEENKIADNHALQGYFNARILKILTKYNKKMMGWDNILREDMPKNILMQSWLGVESLARNAKLGYKTILSANFYIDLIQPTTLHYLNDPIPQGSDLTEEERNLILGGEATMWAEFVNAETIDSRIWPRTAAIAERLWSPQNITDVENMFKRLEYISFSMEELGLTHEKNFPMMLRRLTNNQDISALKNLVDLVEPVKIYTRNEQREHTSFSPLTRVVDAARPDQKIPRVFSGLVDNYLKSGAQADAAELMKYLAVWERNHSQLSPVIEKSPILKEIEMLSVDLADVARIGIEVLNYKAGKKSPGAERIKENLAILQKAKAPRAQVELMIVEPVERLLNSLK